MTERGEALEADFQRYYGLELAGLWAGKLTARRARVLSEHLPPDAAVWRVGPDDVVWSREVQQIAALRDDIRGLLAGDKAQPVPRPSDPPKQTRSIEDKAVAWLARQQRQQQQQDE